MDSSLVYVLISTTLFGCASVFFSEFSQKRGAIWMNAFKAHVAWISFLFAFVITSGGFPQTTLNAFVLLFLSGFIGLNLGDNLLLEAFRRMGAARTLMIFSFQPILIALLAYLFFAEEIPLHRLPAIGILVACVFIVSFEKYRREGRWEFIAPLLALGGVGLDAFGIIMTRLAFMRSPELGTFEANFYRCSGAVVGFWIFWKFFRFRLWEGLKSLAPVDRTKLILASVAGTFISLSLYLKAIDEGTLGLVTAIAGCVPIFSAVFECFYFKQRPSPYLLAALSLFLVGLWILAQ